MKCRFLRGALRAVVVLFGIGLMGCREEILHDLDELHANQVELLLANEGLDVQKIKSGPVWNISVSRGEKIHALSALERSRILSRELSRFQEQGKGLLQTREEKRAVVEREAGRALEQTLESLPGILEARVHFYLPESDVLAVPPPDNPGSASVLLIARASTLIDEGQVRQIVAGARGLSPANISVVLSRSGDESRVVHENSPSFGAASEVTFSLQRLPTPFLFVLLLLSSLLLFIRSRKALSMRAQARSQPSPVQKNQDEKLTPRSSEFVSQASIEVF